MRMLAKMGMLESFVKEAIISAEDHAKGMADMTAKAETLAKLRGVAIPTKDVLTSLDDGIPMYEGKPDIANTRLSTPNMGPSAHPDAPPGSAPGASPLRESEVIKSHNPNANSSLSRIKHRWVNPVKRFMGTTPGKVVGVGALGAAGLGLYSYLNRNKTPQPENYQLSPEDQQMMQQQMYGTKMGAMSGPSTIPTPPPIPRVSSPGPGVSNLPPMQRASSKGSGGGGDMQRDWTKPFKQKEIGKNPMPAKKTAEIDPAIAALVAGGIGGTGGYFAGSKLLAPWMEGKEKDIVTEIAEKQKSIGSWRSARKYTPIGLAALGAVTLAAIAATKARSDERSKMQGLAGHLQQYDPTGAGFGAADQVAMGSPYEQAYN